MPFVKAIGLKLAKFFAKLGKPSISMVSPAVALTKLGFLNMGIDLTKAIQKQKGTPFKSTLAHDLKGVATATLDAANDLAKA